MKPADLKALAYPPSILIYGEAGSGKTALVSQLSNAKLFDFDKGMLTAATLEDDFFDARQKIEFDIFWDENPLKPRAYMDAKKALLSAMNDNVSGKFPFDGIIIDSLTGLCRSMQLFIQSKGDKSNPAGDPLAKMEVQNWGSLINEVDRFLTIIRAMRILLVVTAHVEVEEAKKERGAFGETIVTCRHPKSATRSHGLNSLQWMFDEVWYADRRSIGMGKFAYRIHGMPPNTITQARTRSGIGLIDHTKLGMRGLLELIGYTYDKKERLGSVSSKGVVASNTPQPKSR